MPAALLLVAASVAADKPVAVAALVAQHARLAGRMVEVEGRLVTCGRLSCVLLDEAAARRQDAASLSFADAPAFDASITKAAGHRLVVEGVVLDHCWPDSGELCTDRAPQFQPIRLVRDLDADQ